MNNIEKHVRVGLRLMQRQYSVRRPNITFSDAYHVASVFEIMTAFYCK